MASEVTVDRFGHCPHCYDNVCPEVEKGKLHTAPCSEDGCEDQARLTPSRIAARIGIPVKDWEGRCHEIATKMVEAHLVPGGRAVYGNWRGKMKGIWANRQSVGFTHHGWIVADGGTIVDPTRWSFEGNLPYIYIGIDNPEDDDLYDEGANRTRQELRMKFQGSDSFPATAPGEKAIQLDIAENVAAFVRKLSGQSLPFGLSGIRWLANRSPAELGANALPIYLALKKAGQGGWIPIDNSIAVLGKGGQ